MSEGQIHSIKMNGKSSTPDNWKQSIENECIWWGMQQEIDQPNLLKDGEWAESDLRNSRRVREAEVT